MVFLIYTGQKKKKIQQYNNEYKSKIKLLLKKKQSFNKRFVGSQISAVFLPKLRSVDISVQAVQNTKVWNVIFPENKLRD